MKLILAPMEGLMDHYLRKIVTDQGGFDLVITEFVRVVESKLPDKSFLLRAPELLNQGFTSSNTPVRVQLLGNHPQALAENALRAIELGSHGIDLNFGCPSKTVNKSYGGAVLLKEPETIYRVVKAVREAVPSQYNVSAKMRLGFQDTSLALDNANAIESAGANMLTVHARTKVEGYRPPAHWHWIDTIRQSVNIPVVANGDVFNVEDYHNCVKASGCNHVMLGRGAVYTPNLAKMIKSNDQNLKLPWSSVRKLLWQLFEAMEPVMAEKYLGGRVKQWLNMLKESYPEAELSFESIKPLMQADELKEFLQTNLI